MSHDPSGTAGTSRHRLGIILKKLHSRLGVRLLGAVVAVLIVAGSWLFAHTYGILREEVLDRAEAFHEEIVRGESARMARALGDGAMEALSLAHRAELIAFLSRNSSVVERERAQLRLSSFLRGTAHFTHAAIVNADFDMVLCVDAEGALPCKEGDSLLTRGLDPFNAMARIPVFVDPVSRPVGGAPFLRYTVPVLGPDDELFGILALDFDLPHVLGSLDITTQGHPYFILNEHGRFLAGSLPPSLLDDPAFVDGRNLMQRHRQGRFVVDHGAGDHLVVFSRLMPKEQTGLNLTVAQMIPLSVVYGPLRPVGQTLVLGIVLALGAAVFALALLMHRIVQPVRVLAALVKDYRPGGSIPVPRRYLERRDETGELSRAFRDMGGALQAAFDERRRQLRALAEKNRELRAKTEEARKLANAKGDFLAVMSHEIRTPLNAIAGFSQLLGSEPDETERELYISRICDGSQRLLDLINNILDFTTIQSGHAHLQEDVFLPEEELRIIHEMVARRADGDRVECRFRFDGDTSLALCGDVVRLRQIVQNLADNALKFTHQGNIRLSARIVREETPLSSDEDSRKVRLEVVCADTGIGIAPEKQKTVFLPFEQNDSSLRRRYEGSGLGLAICDRLTQLMGGTLELESRVGEGSVFTLRLPFSMAAENAETGIASSLAAGAAPASLFSEWRFLLIEDDAKNAEALWIYLSRQRARHIRLAATLEEATKALQEETFDLALVDLHLPDGNGLDLIEGVREGRMAGVNPVDIPLIALTAYATDTVRKKALDVGANICFVKPANHNRLLQAVERLLSKPAGRSRDGFVA
ncbi:MAG: response regulator [Opitutales bacterium]|nr:response regulator [Opitutales bacterium]